ncbi:MAG: hypothetical protein ACPGVW_11640 [Pseudoalteromonas marina]|jgi:hypothetical protein
MEKSHLNMKRKVKVINGDKASVVEGSNLSSVSSSATCVCRDNCSFPAPPPPPPPAPEPPKDGN